MAESDTAERYRIFGELEVKGQSPIYEQLCMDISVDDALIAMLDELPWPKRQPNLLFAAVRFLGGPVEDYAAFRAWSAEHWGRITAEMLARSTQTNEAGRCATLLPLLAGLPQPLALLEVGASAGLCLFPDRYAYRFDDRPLLGPAGAATMACRTSGPVPFPRELPQVVWRAGVDLNPLDVRDAEQTRWLEALVWPDQQDRLVRLRAAIEIARTEPPHLVRGDLNDAVVALAAQAPADATLVVFHSAVLAYLSPAERDRFAETVRALPARWISNEAPGVLHGVSAPDDHVAWVLALDGEPVAFTGSHGQRLDWLPG